MALFDSKDKKKSILDLLEDLTHLEINTIVKDGMLATPGKKKAYDMIRDIFDVYLAKFSHVIDNHESISTQGPLGKFIYRVGESDFIEFDDEKLKEAKWGKSMVPISFGELNTRLKSLNRLIRLDRSLRLSVRDFTILRRVASFCEYIFTLDKNVKDLKSISQSYSGDFEKRKVKKLLDVPIKAFSFSVELETADEVKIKRMRDLGTETIVMQTRIGLDGDVITRIERDFAESGGDPVHGKAAEATKNTIIGLHEKHIDISVKYWNSLVNMVKDFVSGLIDNKK
jgi:hypothetical protein